MYRESEWCSSTFRSGALIRDGKWVLSLTADTWLSSSPELHMFDSRRRRRKKCRIIGKAEAGQDDDINGRC